MARKIETMALELFVMLLIVVGIVIAVWYPDAKRTRAFRELAKQYNLQFRRYVGGSGLLDDIRLFLPNFVQNRKIIIERMVYGDVGGRAILIADLCYYKYSWTSVVTKTEESVWGTMVLQDHQLQEEISIIPKRLYFSLTRYTRLSTIKNWLKNLYEKEAEPKA
ncbi:hypothetical protein A3C77_00550 [Candidatus Giovannonibacteria bacterium RIFCSPHIGHO2_02_FULL_45_13]|nr:MAG: hypothetical protein A3C77_00550 [Candidatus Giovannonibacteria bacterium RIFCSPHIGHO2_02_FULL_45_13]